MHSDSRRSSRLAFMVALSLLSSASAHGAPPETTATAPAGDAVRLVRESLATVAAASHARDSLTQLVGLASGSAQDLLEEQVWQRHLEVQAGLIAAAARLERWKQQGPVAPEARRLLDEAVQAGWPRYVAQLDRRNARIQSMAEERDALTGSQRLAREAQITGYIERTARMYHDLVDALLALERLGVDVAAQRAWVIERLSVAAGQTGARLRVLGRERALATASVHRTPDDAAARIELDAVELGMNRATNTFEAEVALLSRLGQDVTPLKVDLTLITGKLTTSALEPRVITGLLRHAQQRFMEMLASHLPRWLFQVLLLVGLFAGFRLLATATRRATRRLVQKADLSQLMRDTIASWSSRLVMLIGVIFLLRQLGFQLGPMLAGFGIAGVVVGFALQDTLANFAAGAMILAYQPFDVGDIIEAGGVQGTVRKMSLVSTTILTFDNQTLIVPNKKVWGDVICNLTAQGTRRVDLTFGVGYESGIEQVEQVLQRIVDADPRVLKEPAPIIKVHRLAESSVDFVVRVWARHDHYWDVYWDTTRAVKLAFDEAGISIPFPQREVHVRMRSGAVEPGAPAAATVPGAPLADAAERRDG